MNIGIRHLRTGIFNFADVWITAGVVILLIWRRGAPAMAPATTTTTAAANGPAMAPATDNQILESTQ